MIRNTIVTESRRNPLFSMLLHLPPDNSVKQKNWWTALKDDIIGFRKVVKS